MFRALHLFPFQACGASSLRFTEPYLCRAYTSSSSSSSSSSSNVHIFSIRSFVSSLRRTIKPYRSKPPSVFRAVRRGCYVTVGSLTLVGFAGWGVQQLMPERSRTWPLLRCGNAVAALAALIIDYKLLGWWDMSACHWRSARRLVRLAERNRGVYVKVGQHASAMEYILPLEYTQQLQQLQRNVPASPMAQVEEVIKQELQIDRLDEVFIHFDETPVGAASLAQVHFAVLANGQPVAVKVQHADVRELAEADTRVVEVLTKVAARIFPQVRFEWLVTLLRENLPAELDFRKEAANADRCRGLLQEGNPTFAFALPRPSVLRSLLLQGAAKAFSLFLSQHQLAAEQTPESTPQTMPPAAGEGKARANSVSVSERQQHSSSSSAAKCMQEAEAPAYCLDYDVELYVPHVYNEFTTSRVLVMERFEGVPVDDLEGIVVQGIHPLAVSAALSELYGRLIFDLGFVHADPHSGNVLVHLEDKPRQGPSFQQQRLRHSARSVLLSSINGDGVALKPQHGDQETFGTRRHLRLGLLDHGLYCSLTHQFRCTYARLWLAMKKGDIAAVTACAKEFGVTKLAGLLAVILSLRSEGSINSGLQLSRKSPEEAEELRNSFPEYFARITNVLQDVPRELVLLIKTNDLLRAIQGRLAVDEALILMPLLHRSLDFVGASELEELHRLRASAIQVLIAKWRLWKETEIVRWAEQLLQLRSMSWATPTDIKAIDFLCNAF